MVDRLSDYALCIVKRGFDPTTNGLKVLLLVTAQNEAADKLEKLIVIDKHPIKTEKE